MLPKDKPLPSWLLILFFSFWLSATFIGLWWFQQDKVKAFVDIEQDLAYFQPNSISQLLQPYLESAGPSLPEQRTLLHFWRPDCLCNRVSQRHFSSLIEDYTPQQLRIIIIAHPNSSEQDLDSLRELNGDRFIILRASDELLSLPSSPSLAIIKEGQLNYFGPYGFGAFCTVREDGFLASIIDAPSQQSFTNVIGEGCFCRWRD